MDGIYIYVYIIYIYILDIHIVDGRNPALPGM